MNDSLIFGILAELFVSVFAAGAEEEDELKDCAIWADVCCGRSAVGAGAGADCCGGC